MTLASLIRGKQNNDTTRPANANFAKVANVTKDSGDIKHKLAGLATLALANPDNQIGKQSAFRGAVEIITDQGERLWIATVPEAVKQIPEGAVFFTGAEIMLLQKTGKEAAHAALLVKQVLGSEATITETGPTPVDK